MFAQPLNRTLGTLVSFERQEQKKQEKDFNFLCKMASNMLKENNCINARQLQSLFDIDLEMSNRIMNHVKKEFMKSKTISE